MFRNDRSCGLTGSSTIAFHILLCFLQHADSGRQRLSEPDHFSSRNA
jgi:hypothetical protein